MTIPEIYQTYLVEIPGEARALAFANWPEARDAARRLGASMVIGLDISGQEWWALSIRGEPLLGEGARLWPIAGRSAAN